MVGEKRSFFDIANTLVLVLVAFLTFYPFWNILVVSFSTPGAYYTSAYHLVPRELTTDAYVYNFSNTQVYTSFFTSVTVTVAGTSMAMVLTIMTAYFLSKKYLKGRNFIFGMFILTMFIGGGLIPFYVLVTKLGMRNTLFALFVPQALNMYFLILTKNYLVSMPQSLEESAKLDGANDFTILLRIVVPTAKPIIATISLFYAVQFWNDWFNPMIFLRDQKLFPLSLYLRNLISEATGQIDQGVVDIGTPATIRAAVMIITITPIILVYPFLQKHFVKGVLLGSVKE